MTSTTGATDSARPQRAWNVKPKSADATFRILLALAAVGYLALVSARLVSEGGWPTPDFLIPPLLLLAVAGGRGWSFLIDWLPMLALVLIYEGFRGLADNLNPRVHYASLIAADEWFFGKGHTGPNVLQSWLASGERVRWYDWLASAAYSAHYVWPMALGFALWLKSRALYWRFTASFLALFLAGFACFYLYPAAPPWMAAENGMIPNVDRVLVNTLSTLPATQPFALAYQRFSPNMVAAMPSLHAGLPMLLALIAVRVWGKRALPLLAYPFVGGLAWVYMGEHYFIDVLAGWLFGIAAFVLVWGVTFPRVAVAVERIAGFLAPRGIGFGRAWPAWPLAAIAALAMAYVWVDPLIRGPFTPQPEPIWVAYGPPAPPGSVEVVAQPGPEQALSIQATPCGTDTPAGSKVDSLLAPVAPQYSAYVVGLGSSACFAISSRAAIPPPDTLDLAEMESDEYKSASPTVLSLSDDAPGYVTVVRAGAPSEALQKATGIEPSGTYALVIRTDGSENTNDVIEVARAVGEELLSP